MSFQAATKELLFQVARNEFGLGPADVLRRIKDRGAPMPFSPDSWAAYITAISDLPPCEYCGSIQHRRAQAHIWLSFVPMVICNANPSHGFAAAVATFIEHRLGLDRAAALRLAAGQECEHGIPIAFCRECGHKAMQKHIEEA